MYNLLIAHVKKFEGCKLESYKCPAGIWTIGFGCTGKDIKQGTVWTIEKATEELCFRIHAIFKEMIDISPILATASEPRQSAIASFIYNCGDMAYKTSTLKKRVDAGDWDNAALEIKRWNKGGGKVLPGLVKRREVESQMLLTE